MAMKAKQKWHAASCANLKAARISLVNGRRQTMTTSAIRAGTTSRSGEPSLDEVTKHLDRSPS